MKDIKEQLALWEQEEGKALFEKMHWRKDAKVLDYGCGYGHYSMALARSLNELGKVYAVDIHEPSLKALKKRLNTEGNLNIEVYKGNKDFKLNFEDETLDIVLYYDILHGGDGSHKKTLLEEAHRVLKANGILSILPFHLSNFRDDAGNKKKYTYIELIREVESYGYKISDGETVEGINFEKCHSSYYLKKGPVEIEALEKAEILNFAKL